MLSSLLTRKNLRTAALCAGGAALLLHPACVVTLGVGALLGYKGKDWMKQYLEQ